MFTPQIKISAESNRVLIDIRFGPGDPPSGPTDPPRRLGRLASIMASVMRWLDRLGELVRDRLW